MASCALCMQPIVGSQKFALSGSEVFHRECVVSHGTVNSVGNRRRLRIVELEGQVAQLEIALRGAQAREQTAAEELRIHRQRATDALRNSNSITEQRDEYRRQRDEARRERDEANAARDAARRELALHQTLSGAQQHAPPAQSASDPAPQDDGKDATEKRFSLMELD